MKIKLFALVCCLGYLMACGGESKKEEKSAASTVQEVVDELEAAMDEVEDELSAAEEELKKAEEALDELLNEE
jgi:outer membrane murein-binding lipoprotein Lpp